MNPAQTRSAASDPSRARTPGALHEADVTSRLRKASGQLAGVTTMYENGRYCIDVLDQLSAVTAAIDAVALLVLEDHVQTCVRDAISGGDPDQKVAEMVSAIRRYVRSR